MNSGESWSRVCTRYWPPSNTMLSSGCAITRSPRSSAAVSTASPSASQFSLNRSSASRKAMKRPSVSGDQRVAHPPQVTLPADPPLPVVEVALVEVLVGRLGRVVEGDHGLHRVAGVAGRCDGQVGRLHGRPRHHGLVVRGHDQRQVGHGRSSRSVSSTSAASAVNDCSVRSRSSRFRSWRARLRARPGSASTAADRPLVRVHARPPRGPATTPRP